MSTAQRRDELSRHEPSGELVDFLAGPTPATPFLVLDLAVVERQYRRLAALLPDALIHYAVKANPHPAVLGVLVGLGARFDVASVGEIRLCLDAGADPATICYGNPVRKASDVVAAYAAGVRWFVTDSPEDLYLLGRHARGSEVLCRLVVGEGSARTPFGRKFGAIPRVAGELLQTAGRAGLHAAGVAFHTGSQQLDPQAFADGVEVAAQVVHAAGLADATLDVGGGFPIGYLEPVPPLADYAAAIDTAMAAHFTRRPRLIIEPGRALVANAGVLRSEVVRVSRRPGVNPRRWVYLDVGRYGGLAETEGEAIGYRLRTPGRAGPDEAGPEETGPEETGPEETGTEEAVVIAGPTCDGDDVLYQRTPYRLPADLQAGDNVDFLAAGAYTASYASVGFNGIAPLPVFVLGDDLVD